jgi:hypothetical protein
LRCALIVLRERQNLRVSNASAFAWLKKFHLTAVGCEQQAEHPTDRPPEQQRQLSRCAAAWDGGSSRHHVRRNFAGRFRPIIRGANPISFCELVNIAQRLKRQKIHVTPPTDQHAIASVTIVQMSQRQKKL